MLKLPLNFAIAVTCLFLATSSTGFASKIACKSQCSPPAMCESEKTKNSCRELCKNFPEILGPCLKYTALLGVTPDFDLLLKSGFECGSIGMKKCIVTNLEAYSRHQDITKMTYIKLERIDEKTLNLLSTMINLKKLDLSSTGLEDEHLEYLEKLKKLENLDLSNNEGVTDKGITHLEKLQKLRFLKLSNTRVTRAGGERIKKKLPNLKKISVKKFPAK